MFVVVYDPSAADDLVVFLRGHGCQARKRTPFVVQIEAPAEEATVERLFSEWHGRQDVPAELLGPREGAPPRP